MNVRSIICKLNTKRAVRALIFAGSALFLFLTVPAESVQAEESELLHPDRVIRNGVTINGIDVGGLTEEEALLVLQEEFAGYGNADITLEGNEEEDKAVIPASEFGVSWTDTEVLDEAGNFGHGSNIIARYKEEKDLEHNGAALETPFSVSTENIEAIIDKYCAGFNREAKDAVLTKENGSFIVTPGTSGVIVNKAESAVKIADFLENEWAGKDSVIKLEVEIDEPAGTADELAEIKDLLGSFTTSFNSSGSARCQNISNACSMINGKVLLPGEQFSILKTITPFTEENGYALAGSYLGSQVVESLGGGICQVSTTLYNAVIRAELEVNERHNHSLIVNYVDPSDDAAIAESTGLDFRFTNNLDAPIFIEGYVSGKSITFNIYGEETRDPGRSVSFVSETLETIQPEGEAVYTDNTAEVGTITYTAAHMGYKAQLWKIVKQDGVEVSREIFNKSTYNMAPRSCTVGTQGTMTQRLRTAIADQSIEECEAAIALLPADQAAEAQGTTLEELQQAAALQEAAAANGENAQDAAGETSGNVTGEDTPQNNTGEAQ